MNKKIKRTELDSYEVYILGLTILGKNTEDEEKIDVAKSPLTKKIYKGFSKDKEGFKEWLIKEEV